MEQPSITVDEDGGLFFFRGRIIQELTVWLVGAIRLQADLSTESLSNVITTSNPLSTPGEIGHETANSMESSEPHLPSRPRRPVLLSDTHQVFANAGWSISESIAQACDNLTLVGSALKTGH